MRGLVDLDSAYTLAISAAVIAIFVFGLMLQRRREYVVLRAQGLPARRLQLLIARRGGLRRRRRFARRARVGGALGVLLVHVLKPLFILAPVTALPVGEIALLAGLLAAATALAALAALAVVSRLSVSEVLRER